MPLEPIFFNGDWIKSSECAISPFDRGFLFADSCYEVLPIYQGKVFGLEQHIDRLDYSLKQLSIKNIYSKLEWISILNTLANQTQNKAYIYLQITRGINSTRDISKTSDLMPTVLAYAEQVSYSKELPKAINAQLVEDFRWKRCDIKTTALVAAVIAKQQCLEKGFDDVIYHDQGEINECSASNLFVLHQGVIKTPPISNRLLSGITRSSLFELLQNNNFEILEKPISLQDLSEVEEAWYSGSVKELVPIVRIEGKNVADGEVGATFKKIWQLWLEKHYHNFA